MTAPYLNTSAARLINERIQILASRKTQAEIAGEVGFKNPNMMTYLKHGRNKVPIDRVPALARALEVDPVYLMRLTLEQSVGLNAAKAIIEIFGYPVTLNEKVWLDELRVVSGNSDPVMTSLAQHVLKQLFT